jgi:hypothetical protein
VKSREEAIAWAKKCPGGENEMIEVRQIQAMEDFPDDVQKAAEGFNELRKS